MGLHLRRLLSVESRPEILVEGLRGTNEGRWKQGRRDDGGLGAMRGESSELEKHYYKVAMLQRPAASIDSVAKQNRLALVSS
jgi:hypothetical protein